MDIKDWDPVLNEFTLYEPMPNDIQIGDSFSATYGCNKSYEDACEGRYANRVNFRGEPHIPIDPKIPVRSEGAPEWHRTGGRGGRYTGF
jgi:hypothetical protein